MTNHTTDLAARFEAKREDCEKKAQDTYDTSTSATVYWVGRARSFAEARDMARAGAAGGAGWQPISSAPKDGTCVLLGFNAYPENDWCAVSGWFETGINDQRWYDIYHGEIVPTHWMPSPSPPAQQDSGTRYQYREIGEGDGWRDCSKDTYDSFARDPHIDTREISPPPAQQGSSSPPLTAERVDLGELERLDADATPGTWGISAGGRIYLPGVPDPRTSGAVIADYPGGVLGHEQWAKNRAFIVALVNAYRSGRLIETPVSGEVKS